METGYVHGSDMLVGLMIQETFTPMGHSKTCTISNKAETKERAVKPTLEEKKAAANAGKWKEKSVSGLSVEISSEGFKFYGDDMGYDKLLELWEKASRSQCVMPCAARKRPNTVKGNSLSPALKRRLLLTTTPHIPSRWRTPVR